MYTKEYELKLAELMGWELETISNEVVIISKDNDMFCDSELCPYDNCQLGLAQFSAILLKYPEVMCNFMEYTGNPNKPIKLGYHHMGYLKPTQENILNEILRTNDFDID